MRRLLRPLVTALLTASLAAAPAGAKPRPAPPLAGLDAYVGRAMREFGVPGMAVAVVKDGQILLARGYGVRRAGEPAPKPESIRRLWSAQTAQGTPDPPPGLEATRAGFAAYGLGFGLRDYRGHKVASHTGGLPGYVSQVALVPGERLGLVVLTNQEEAGAFEAVKYRIFDEYLGAPVPPVDWIVAFRKRAEDERKKAEEAVAKAAAARDASSRPSLPPARYATGSTTRSSPAGAGPGCPTSRPPTLT